MPIHDETPLQQSAHAVLPAIYLIWAGLILGISFIATPVKFQSPQLTMPMALDVGKATFHLFNTIEWFIIIALIVLTAISSDIPKKWPITVLLFCIVALQTFWLLPVLEVRVNAVIAGGTPVPGQYHELYIVLEIFKLALTIAAAWFCSRPVK